MHILKFIANTLFTGAIAIAAVGLANRTTVGSNILNMA